MIWSWIREVIYHRYWITQGGREWSSTRCKIKQESGVCWERIQSIFLQQTSLLTDLSEKFMLQLSFKVNLGVVSLPHSSVLLHWCARCHFFLSLSKAHTIQFPILCLVDVISENIERYFSYPSSDGGRGNDHLDAKVCWELHFYCMCVTGLVQVCGRCRREGVRRKRHL